MAFPTGSKLRSTFEGATGLKTLPSFASSQSAILLSPCLRSPHDQHQNCGFIDHGHRHRYITSCPWPLQQKYAKSNSDSFGSTQQSHDDLDRPNHSQLCTAVSASSTNAEWNTQYGRNLKQEEAAKYSSTFYHSICQHGTNNGFHSVPWYRMCSKEGCRTSQGLGVAVTEL